MDSLLLLLLLTLSSSAASGRGFLRLPSDKCGDLYCNSWRVSVEANNEQNGTVPARCADYVKQYMTGDGYISDMQIVANESLAFAETVTVAGDGKDVWVFDIDETLLSNRAYYANFEYGAKKGDGVSFAAWVEKAEATALDASLDLYKYLNESGFQIVMITGRREAKRSFTVTNLESKGYLSKEYYPVCEKDILPPAKHPKCAMLIMRGESDYDTAAVYKSKQRTRLVDVGYKIHGNSGDQWSDLLYTPMAKKSFKLSNPMYYIPN